MKKMHVVLWLKLYEMNTAKQVQILHEAVCISHTANTLKKSMNPTTLFPGLGKL